VKTFRFCWVCIVAPSIFEVPSSAKFLYGFLPSLLGQHFRAIEKFVVPLMPKKIKKFRMLCTLYSPALRGEDLDKDRRKRREQLDAEGERLREAMVKLLEKLDTASNS
jgi:hypothetical protein